MVLQRRWLVGGALALAGMAAVVALLSNRAKPVRVAEVARTDLQQSVAVTGRINAPARIDVASEVTATVTEVAAREGDRVRAGQLLIRLSDAEARSNLVQAQASLTEAQQRVREQDSVFRPVSDASLAQAQANLDNARAELERARALVAKGFYPQQKLDDAQRTLLNAQAAEAAARVQSQSNRHEGVAVALLQSRLAQAHAAVAVAQARLDRLHISAPMDARVLTRNVEPGTMAQPGRVILTLAGSGATRIDAAVDEKNLGLLQLGMAARARADAFANQPFDARLAWISPAVDAQRGTVEVRLDVPQPPPWLRTDMTVSVDMLGPARPDALVLPSAAVRDADRSAPWVLVLRDGHAQNQPVKLGLLGVGSLEVVDGVQAGEQVILQTEKAVAGDRVRALPPDTPAPRPMEMPQGMGSR
jgi:HlyD family secretion protein